jgi:hypothetical protein
MVKVFYKEHCKRCFMHSILLKDLLIIIIASCYLLSYNLLSVSQLYEMGYNHLFTDKSVIISRRKDSSAFTGRLKGMLYLVDFNKSKTKLETCLVAKLT